MSSSKRKSQSTVTLHDFFSAGAGPLPKLKEKQKATPTPARRKQLNASISTKPAQEIIVIDSDTDSGPEVVQVVQTKRKRQRSLSSDGEVEFVDCDSKRPVVTSQSSKNSKAPARNGQPSKPNFLPRPPKSGPSSAAQNPQHSEGNDEHVYTFGAPYLLVNNRTPSSSTADPTPPTPLSFGAPTLLLGRNSTSLPSNQLHASSSHPLRPAESVQNRTPPSDEDSSMDLNLPDDLTDDWGMGDDETAFARPPDVLDEEVEEMPVDVPREDEGLTPAEPEDTRCPSCDLLLNGLSHLELTQHVNDCLDSAASSKNVASSSNAAPAPRKQPLSTLVPPKVHGPMQLISCDGKTRGPRNGTGNGNAFSVLMASHKENEAWKEATVAEDHDFRPAKSNGGRRKAPFYKILQGMPIAVDAFRYGTIPNVKAYFLTHAHSDHYTNLASNWKSGPIYCSEGTANLIIHMLSVDKKWVHPLPMDVPTVIPNTGGVSVTLIEANHCPGSCLFYFEGLQTIDAGDSAYKSPFVGSKKTFRYLHCGDFRASPRHILHPSIKGKRVDHVYLDTTYLDPKYTFPPQPLVISACAELARKLVSGESLTENTATMDAWRTSSNENAAGKQKKADKMLIVVGTYSIGKERIVKAVANALQSKVYCEPRKAAILRCQADAQLDALLTSNPLEASVHLVPLGLISSDKLKEYMERFKGEFTKAAGLRPTGWTYTPPTGTDQMPSIASIISRPHRGFTSANLRPARNSTPALQLFPVPYSEHSSFFELTCFAMSFDWGKMIATVNVGSETSRGKMAKWVARWETERKKRGKDALVPHRDIEYW